MKANLKLTSTELWHLIRLLQDNEAMGEYWGNQKQYWLRHARLLVQLCEAHESLP